MPGLNGRPRGDGRLRQVHHARGSNTGTMQPVAAEVVDVKALLENIYGQAQAHIIAQQVEPFIAHNAAIIAELQTQVRDGRIAADQLRRLHEREHRAQERRIEALTAELDLQQRHSDSLRRQLKEERGWEELGRRIVDAARGVKA